MFDNNTSFVTDATGANQIDLSLVDGPTNQRTIRRGSVTGGKYELSIAHQGTNENPGFITQRSNVRLSLTKVDVETGKEFTAYAQLTISVPTDMVVAADVAKQVGHLVCFLYNGGDIATISELPASGSGFEVAFLSVVSRLLAGEP